ncbi:MAG TPA: leucyl aminopeptidase [Actinomycetota bacterium]|nr:leucyl aminopeptidase [Actinomycetota bacterium]
MTAFELSSAPAQAAQTPVVVVGAHTARQLTPQAQELDAALGGGLAAHLEATGFKGEVGDATTLPTLGRLPAASVVVVGLGPGGPGGSGAGGPGGPTTDALRRAAGTAARRTGRATGVTLALPQVPGGAQAQIEGYLLGSYRFDRYKSSAEPRSDATVALDATEADLRRGEAIAGAVNWARGLVAQPAGDRPPAVFAEQAAERATAAGLRAEVLDEAELARRGMHGILGVGQGSRFPPRLLLLHYEPEGATAHLGAIGKGITFDSGGLSLKPAESMETMKTDCSGAAAVAAALCALPALGPRIKVTAAMPIAENMPGGSAIKPGDVIRHYGGHTSEVLNTDAEGRLVLADALAWMAEQKPDAMIDFATLTGAMTIALGRKVAGFFATEPALAAELQAAAENTGERIWQMPLLEDLRRQGDSEVADIKNIGTRFGGAIFAALFLKEFTAGVPWLHVDIAGPARSEEAEHHIPKGPTGMGTRLLIEWIEARARG